MGTNNFYKKNAKNYYAVLMNDDYNDEDYYYEYAYDDFKEVLKDILKQEFKDNIKHNKRLIKKINKEFNNIIDKLENIYSQLSTPLIKIGGFSDGTAIYKAL